MLVFLLNNLVHEPSSNMLVIQNQFLNLICIAYFFPQVSVWCAPTATILY